MTAACGAQRVRRNRPDSKQSGRVSLGWMAPWGKSSRAGGGAAKEVGGVRERLARLTGAGAVDGEPADAAEEGVAAHLDLVDHAVGRSSAPVGAVEVVD